MRRLLAIFLCMGIFSCEKPAPTSTENQIPAKNSSLASAQFHLAKNHLENGSPEKALAYLQASLETDPTPKAKSLLAEILEKTRFSVPTYRLDHPFPVTNFIEHPDSVYIAISGEFSTLIRWKLSPDPQPDAILFPTKTGKITDITLSPTAAHLLIQRGKTNLLCTAQDLKPIANLGAFPSDLAPSNLQPFSKNGLLLAHPTSDERNLTWHIRDAATGEILRNETFSRYPAPIFASFEDTTLVVTFENRTECHIPIVGDMLRQASPNPRQRAAPGPNSERFSIDQNALTFHQTIPYSPAAEIDLKFISGYSLDPETQELKEIPVPDRLTALSIAFPNQIPETFRISSAEKEVTARLAIAFPEKLPQLAAPQIAHAGIVWQTFDQGDPAAIAASISALPPAGLPTATALFLALKSGDQELTGQVLEVAESVPAPILQLRTGRSDYTAQEFSALRQEQDWSGYESPDFTPLVEEIEAKKTAAAEHLHLTADPSKEEIETLITYLFSAEAMQLLGSEKLANAALSEAGKLVHKKPHAVTALQLAAIAHRLGADEAAILRTRATAFTTLEDFESAHDSWIDLITNRPEATHRAADYSEAAYTAFENANPEQAMEILNTGFFRFPNDLPFTIRAGWIAMLTDQPETALRYLQHATALGLPPDEIENTTALLAIAHTQLGNPDKALAFLEQLKAIDEKWGEPENIEELPWPEHLKAPLRQLIWQP